MPVWLQVCLMFAVPITIGLLAWVAKSLLNKASKEELTGVASALNEEIKTLKHQQTEIAGKVSKVELTDALQTLNKEFQMITHAHEKMDEMNFQRSDEKIAEVAKCVERIENTINISLRDISVNLAEQVAAKVTERLKDRK